MDIFLEINLECLHIGTKLDKHLIKNCLKIIQIKKFQVSIFGKITDGCADI